MKIYFISDELLHEPEQTYLKMKLFRPVVEVYEYNDFSMICKVYDEDKIGNNFKRVKLNKTINEGRDGSFVDPIVYYCTEGTKKPLKFGTI